MDKKKVLVIGGGFGGVFAAKALERRARGKVEVELFAPHAGLLHGHDGGMNKTGTMSGVSTLAGYADTKNHGRVRFVIAMKGKGGATRFELLKAIEAGL
jgi:serine-type D-Ala-D-Ala carboxypeptidase/endopeptidase (penicillin-binding protein 4)